MNPTCKFATFIILGILAPLVPLLFAIAVAGVGIYARLSVAEAKVASVEVTQVEWRKESREDMRAIEAKVDILLRAIK